MKIKLEKLSEEWIQATQQGSKGHSNHWSVDCVIDLHLKKKHHELWKFIKHTYQQDLSDTVVANLAAGPLENLLSQFGEEYIDEIESLAKKDPKFKDLLGGVWQNNMSAGVWSRVCAVRGKAW